MLDNQTKKRIDDCRDILVGKLPDPKAQIEQITIALIYKFMDDMDKEAIDLGGSAKFFSGDFEKYSWDNLFDTKVTAIKMLELYSESIQAMEKNPNIPQLFSDIFKNAFLPYRDPETLKLFLKTIGEFEYTHSEKLGDAFEYLLSVMGSQGDAGQFRTPRHIIDFLVAVVNPDKTDKILDPACGTAGFLISAFKYIKEKNHNKFNPEEQKRLIQNFVGYDISPDMVRLSLVNLYLHGFLDPQIHEYDTLSSEDRWNESYDVILANPPFMSPKGGIRPHKKFSINSNRSEVLFVDYIAEHLNPKGRAGIIVPEGIIFQSGNAYKDLRKMLVEKYLYAVVSLPAGVFNPYSGVKTSILLMDRELSKTRKEILFVKIENDGFGLGAQRNSIKGGQLDDAIQIIKQFREGNFTDSSIAHSVSKELIAENGDYNLSGDRYKIATPHNHLEFPLKKIIDVTEIKKGSSITKALVFEGTIPVIAGGQQPAYYHNESNRIGKTITVSSSGAYAGFINYFEQPIFASDCTTIQSDESLLKTKFLFHILKSKQDDFYKLQKGGAQPHVYGKDFGEIQIPLPPLSVQEEIVEEIEGYQKIIDGAKLVVENYKPKIDIDPEWGMVKMQEIAKVNPESKDPAIFFEDWFTYIDISSVENGTGVIDYSNVIKIVDAPSRARRLVQLNDILLSTVRPNLKAFGFIDKEPNRFIASTGFALLRTNEKCTSKFLYYLVFQDFLVNQMISSMEKGAYPSINQNDVNNLNIPLPPLETQKQIVEQIEREQELVNANKELITIFEQKIKNRIAKVWGEEKPSVDIEGE